MSIFRYCPICATEFVYRQHDGRLRQICPACAFVHYRNPVPAAGCLIERGAQVLLVQRKYPPHVGWWTLPAGFVEWEETPEQAAIRETREETGLQVEVQRLYGVFPWHHEFSDGLAHESGLLVIYEASLVGGELQAGDDAQAVGWFASDTLPEQIAFASHQLALSQWAGRTRHPG